jgi:FtsP/CotA-like multicopper oxidase with cupredoxin domain
MTTNLSQLICIGALLATSNLNAQYTKLHIPDTLSGTHFNLVLKDTFTQYKTGQTTITSGINGNFWGPTIFINKGDTVFMNILNKLNDSTTIQCQMAI